ncbi:MAG: PKD domain-containing protein, partial [Taibaiella sp.]|nr:PKD domain-containing protein [Taibaiella sp.]
MVRIYSVILLVLLISTQVFAGKKVRVLFLGNSYTYVNNMPQIVTAMAASTGDTLVWEMEAPGGYTFGAHYTSMASKNKIKQGNWDYVVLQEQSQAPALPDNLLFNNTYLYARLLDSLVNINNTCAETIYYMTWGRKNGDAGSCATYTPQGWPHFCTYLGMDSVIRARYETMANDNQAIVSPVGAVWRVIRLQHPNIELYDADESHPSMAGSYAAACAFYTALFRKDPTQVSFNGTLNATVAADIKAAAKKVVYDSMAYWHIGQYRTEADFSYAIGAGNAVNFTNKSVNGTSYTWHFGDGQTSTDANPSHTYNDTGKYLVMLISSKGGCSDTVYEEVYVSSVDVGNVGLAQQFTIAPNPVQNLLLVRSTLFGAAQCELAITNTYGQIIQGATATRDELQRLDVSTSAPGLYFLTVYSGSAVVYRG